MNIRTCMQLGVLTIAAALAVGCGGGGSSGDSGTGPTPVIAKWGGSVTKGIVRNGLVTLSEVGSSGGLTTIGTGRTGANGRYLIDYSGYTGGVVQACVTADAQTTVVCDASDGPDCGASNGAAGDTNSNGTFDLGETFAAPANFSMCTRLLTAPAESVSAPITPFTNLVVARAAERASASGETPQTALANAASEVNQLLGGLDVLRLDPIDLSNPAAVSAANADARVYSALIAAIVGNAVEDLATGQSINLNTVVNSLLTVAQGGQIGLTDFRELLDEAQQQLQGVGQSDDSGVIAMLNQQIDAAQAGGENTFNPEPTSNAGASRIQRARGLIQNLRNTVVSLDQYQAPLDSFGVDIQTAAAVVDANQILASRFSDVYGAALEFFLANVQPQGECADGVCSFTDADGILSSFTVTGGGARISLAITGTAASDGITFDFLGSTPSFFGDGLTTLVLTTERNVVSNAFARLSALGNITVVLTEPFNAVTALDDLPDNEQSPAIIDSIAFDVTGTVQALQAGNVIGAATGSIDFDVVRATGCTLAPTDPAADPALRVNLANLTISGEVSSGAESADLTVAFNLTNARSFCVDTDIGPNNRPDADLTVTANLILDGVPNAQAVFTASLDNLLARTPDNDDDRTQLVIASTSVSLMQGNMQVFRIQAASSQPQGSNNERVTVTVTDPSNASIALALDVNAPALPAGDIGVISVDGLRVGVIRQLDGGPVLARYDDGSFESLF